MANLPPIPSNAFSGAAVRFNNEPVDRMLMLQQQMAVRNQSRDFAIQKYFGQQGNKLTSTGMDGNTDPDGYNDVQDMLDKKNQWENFATINRKQITNPSLDGGKALVTSNAMYNEVNNIAAQSRAKMADRQKIAAIQADPTKSALLTDPAMEVFQNATLGVNNPKHKPVDWSSPLFNPKPWGSTDEMQLVKESNDVKGTPVQPITKQDPNTGEQTTMSQNQLGDKDLNQIYNIGASRYHTNPGFKFMIDNIIKAGGQDAHNYANLYQNKFGNYPMHPEDIAAAYALSRNTQETPIIKSSPIPGYGSIAMAEKEKLAQMQSGLTFGRELKLANIKGQQATNAAHQEVENLYQASKSNPIVNPDMSVSYDAPVTQDLKNSFSYTDPATKSKVAPLAIRFSKDGQTVTPIYVDAQNNIDHTHSVPATREQFEQSYIKNYPKSGAKLTVPTPPGAPGQKKTVPGLFK